MISEQTLKEVTRRLVEGFHPEAIILFGSRARGTADEESDLDLLVVCRNVEDRRALATAMRASLWGLRVGTDIVVFTPEEFEREKNRIDSVARPAAQEGRLLHGRAA